MEIGNKVQESRISVTFVSPTNKASKVSLKVGVSPRWRTWAKKGGTKKSPGTWQVVVRDAAGNELGRGSFVVAP